MRIELFLILALTIPLWAFGQNDECFASKYGGAFGEYAGVFKIHNSRFVSVRLEKGELLLRPGFWTTTLHLRHIQSDSFVVKRHERLSAIFQRDRGGRIVAVELKGFREEKGLYHKATRGIHPVELIFSGRIRDAIRSLRRDSTDEEMMINIGTTIVENIPSQIAHAKEYLEQLESAGMSGVSLYRSLGDCYFSAGQTEKAVLSYRKSLAIDNTSSWATTALQMLHILPYYPDESKDSSWQLPFSLEELFKSPTPAEINEVKKEWGARDLVSRDAKVVDRDTMMFGELRGVVNLVSHKINGLTHYGAIIVPANPRRSKLAAVVDFKGVSWNYFPLDLNKSDHVYSPRFLCSNAPDFIYIVPSFRGERLLFKGKEFVSEGDRTNVWDGAADDGIALLNVALELFPQIDKEKITAFGKSRGGTVALLMGIRDKRVKRVVDWVGPVDMLGAVFQGWHQKQLVEAGIMTRSGPANLGGQFIETFLLKSINGKEGLRQMRRRLIASSPLYFTDLIPKTQVHYGLEDNIVPPLNGERLERSAKSGQNRRIEAYYHENEGHDLDMLIAYGKSREFLVQVLILD